MLVQSYRVFPQECLHTQVALSMVMVLLSHQLWLQYSQKPSLQHQHQSTKHTLRQLFHTQHHWPTVLHWPMAHMDICGNLSERDKGKIKKKNHTLTRSSSNTITIIKRRDSHNSLHANLNNQTFCILAFKSEHIPLYVFLLHISIGIWDWSFRVPFFLLLLLHHISFYLEVFFPKKKLFLIALHKTTTTKRRIEKKIV